VLNGLGLRIYWDSSSAAYSYFYYICFYLQSHSKPVIVILIPGYNDNEDIYCVDIEGENYYSEKEAQMNAKGYDGREYEQFITKTFLQQCVQLVTAVSSIVPARTQTTRPQ
jgi:hypothetical protein